MDKVHARDQGEIGFVINEDSLMTLNSLWCWSTCLTRFDELAIINFRSQIGERLAMKQCNSSILQFVIVSVLLAPSRRTIRNKRKTEQHCAQRASISNCRQPLLVAQHRCTICSTCTYMCIYKHVGNFSEVECDRRRQQFKVYYLEECNWHAYCNYGAVVSLLKIS